MASQEILTIDFGTQSVRTGIFDAQGNVLAMEKQKYEPAYFSTLPNYAEQDPNYYFECLCQCTNRLAKEHGDLLKNVAGITLTCFRDSAVLLDQNMKVIRPMILWLDQRTAECPKKLPAYQRALFRLIGKTDTINFNRKRSVGNWIAENEPENWAKVHKFINVSTYFIYLLTGELKDSASNQSGHYPINDKKRAWDKNPEKDLTGQIFNLKKSMLCTLVPEGSLIGAITKEAAAKTGLPEGLKMYACGSDKSCETLGLGVISDKVGALSYGTASSIETTRTRYTESEPFLPGFPSCIPGYYNMDIQIYRGYWMINWFLKEFGGREVNNIMMSEVSVDDYNRNLKLVPPGSDGLILQPYWGPGLSRPLAKGAVIGFSDAITKEHFYRAIIEGIAYALREGLEHFEHKIHHSIPALRVSGGGAQSDEICQITADVFGREVSRVQTVETSSLGAAIAGFLAIGVYANAQEATAAMVQIKDTFKPDPATHKKYDYLYKKAYRQMYPSLKGIYQNIKDFNKSEEKEARSKTKKA
jgi:sugar (pentulose or hexulose) kinase